MRFQLFVVWIFYARNLDCLFARFAFVGDRRLESVAESGGVLFPFQGNTEDIVTVLCLSEDLLPLSQPWDMFVEEVGQKAQSK